MDLFKSIGLSATEVKKISPEISEAVDQLEKIAPFAQSKTAPVSIKDAYNSLFSQVQRAVLSQDFAAAAKKKGVSVSAPISKEEEVVVKEIPKVRPSLKDLAAGAKPTVKEEAEVVTEKPSKPSLKDIASRSSKTGEPKEPVIETPITEASIDKDELYGFGLTGSKSAEITGREHLSTMLSYGGTDYILGRYSSSIGYHYRLDLPNSEAQMVITLSLNPENELHNSILSVWKKYVDEATAKIEIVGVNEKEILALKNLVGSVSSMENKSMLTQDEMKGNVFDESNYEDANDLYSRSMEGDTYYDIARKIKSSWQSRSTTSMSLNTAYGLQFADYVYSNIERLYEKGGQSIVTQKMTFFVPKGLPKSQVFAEIGTPLKALPIKTKSFDKNVELGKKFQAQTGKIDDAVPCRVVCSSKDDTLYLATADGKIISINRLAHNHFKKYYSSPQMALASETVVIMENDVVVGLIPAKSASTRIIVGMYDIDAFKTELRNIDLEAYDFMTDLTVSKAEETAEEIDKIEEDKEDSSKLKEELSIRVEFLQELYEEAVEDNDNQVLIDELDLELDTLKDLLEEID